MKIASVYIQSLYKQLDMTEVNSHACMYLHPKFSLQFFSPIIALIPTF